MILNQDSLGLTSTKCCTKCGESLPLSQFYSRHSACKPCVLKRQAARVLREPYKRSCQQAKNRAKSKGLDFDLTPEFLESIDLDRCPYLEIPMEWTHGQKRQQPFSKSLDRIDSAKGYTQDNVIICSWRANELLKDGSLPELTLLVHNFRRILTSTKPTNES